MAETVIMPKLGFDMAEGTLVRWVMPEGEKVAKGAVLAEIETDKATVEVESTFEGVVAAPPGSAGRCRAGQHADRRDRRGRGESGAVRRPRSRSSLCGPHRRAAKPAAAAPPGRCRAGSRCRRAG